MSEEELRREAVRRRIAGESPLEIAEALGRSSRWVRKWVARYGDDDHDDGWAQSQSRAPHTSPNQTPGELAGQILAARERLVSNPRAQYGALAIQWELRCLGVDPIPPSWTIERVLHRAGVTRPRRAQPGYISKGVAYPAPVGIEPGTTHQVDMVGPRHLFGGVQFHALNLIDIGSHKAGSDIVEVARPTLLAASLAGIWGSTGVPVVAQFDNHPNFRGGIPPAWQHFGPIVATCLDLGVIPRFIPLREPWRNGVVEHFNDTWNKSFFRTEVFTSLDHLRLENTAFIAFHNAHHRYSAHAGHSPDEIWAGRLRRELAPAYEPPTQLPDRGRIEVVRYIRSNRRIDLFGKRITVGEDQTHQYVTAIINVGTKSVVVVTLDGEIIHDGDYAISRYLR